jgi:hypothetical protein
MFAPWPTTAQGFEKAAVNYARGLRCGTLPIKTRGRLRFAFSMHDVLMMCVGGDVARVLVGTRATNSTTRPALAALADLSRIDLV